MHTNYTNEMQKIFIKNRKDQKISIIIEKANSQVGLVFIMHGLGGYKEQPQLQSISEIFLKNNYTVIRFDTTNTLGESDGSYEDATVTNYYEDLEDVISRSKTQEFYEEPFVLVGHSLGGICTALFAQNYSEKIKALAPLSTVVSGKLSIDTHKKYHSEEFKKWEETGWRDEESRSKPGMVKRLKWGHIQDRIKYDLLPNVSKLKMPVLLIVGEKDTHTPLEHQKILYNSLPGKKELHVIKDSSHTFRDKKHLKEIQKIFDNWIEGLK